MPKTPRKETKKAKNWIANIKLVDVNSDHLVQHSVIKSLDAGINPTYQFYSKILPVIKERNSRYPSLPKITKLPLQVAWGQFTDTFKGLNGSTKGNSKTHNPKTGEFVSNPFLCVRDISSIAGAPVIPTNFLQDIKGIFKINKNDLAIDRGQSSVIFLNQMAQGNFTETTNRFFEKFKVYAADAITNFNKRFKKKSNDVIASNNLVLQLLKYGPNERFSKEGLKAHHDIHHFGSLIWVLEEDGCQAIFEYQEVYDKKWIPLGSDQGYKLNSEMITVNNIYHRVSVHPTTESSNWSRTVLIAFM